MVTAAPTAPPTENAEALFADSSGRGANADPHESKVAPDDPRLRLGRARGRTLRKGPAIALVATLAGVILVSLAIAFEPKASPSAAQKTAEGSVTGAAVVPDAIRFAPDKPPASGPPLHLVAFDAGAPSFGGSEAPLGRGPSALRDPYSPERQKQTDEEQAWKAQNASVLFEVGSGPAAPSERGGSSGEPSPPPSLQVPGTSSSSSPRSDEPNFQDRKNAFLDGVGASKSKRSLEAMVHPPVSPYEIKAGSIIPAVLLTAINSDLPGPVIGQVRESVYDTVSGNYLLIPQGSRILATYDSMVSWGQERVLVCWNRLIFPNGNSIDLDCMPAADLEGAAGLSDSVNEHWGRLIKGAAISSLLAATTTAVAGNTEGFQPTVPQMWARSASGEINGIGQRLTARNLNIQPTITVRAGYSVNVMVTKDLIVPPYPSNTPSHASILSSRHP
jgi:type IV secretion system protein VirB10